MTLRNLSLFSGSGIGDLAALNAGIATVAQAENDPCCMYCLEELWPDTVKFRDVHDVTAESLRERGCWPIDIVSGGFPCQDISTAGKGEGIEGKRSGLWFQMRRIIDEVRPAWVLAENVPALRGRGSDIVLAGLEELGYTCWPVVVGAWAVGAPHKRDRVWIVGRLHDTMCTRRGRNADDEVQARRNAVDDASGALEYAEGGGQSRYSDFRGGDEETIRASWPIAHAASQGDSKKSILELANSPRQQWQQRPDGDGVGECGNEAVDDSVCRRHGSPNVAVQAGRDGTVDAIGVGDSQRERSQGRNGYGPQAEVAGTGCSDRGLADTNETRRQERLRLGIDDGTQLPTVVGSRWPSRPGEPQHEWEAPRLVERGVGLPTDGLAERLLREAFGIPAGVRNETLDRVAGRIEAITAARSNKSGLRIAGNGWVSQIPELIYRWIVEVEGVR